MAGYKETPRQKMIAMMYLVLTALLALNVSKEILNAFLVVNESMESTNETLSTRIDNAYAKFQIQYDLNKDKVSPYYIQAQQLKGEAVDFVAYLENLKFQLVMYSERKDSLEILDLFYQDTTINGERTQLLMLAEVTTKDKYDRVTYYMVRKGDMAGEGEAYILSARMQTFRDHVLEIRGLSSTSKSVGLITNMDGVTYQDADGRKQDWEQHNFYTTILAADITILNRIIGEVKSAEYNAVNYLYSSVSETDFKFDKVEAKVIPKRTYIFKGQDYEAEVLVAAIDENMNATVKYVHGSDSLTDAQRKNAKSIDGQAGMVQLKFTADKEGMQKYAGVIEMLDPETEKMTPYHFNGEYIVAPPALIVSPLKMNVLYIGVDNPVGISSPGIPSGRIQPSIGHGVLKKDTEGDNWIVRINKMPKGVNRTTISASAKIDNKDQALGSMEFRVKRVPTPNAEIAGQSDGQMDKNRLLAAGAIIPNMRDFEFEIYYQVTGYTFATIINGDWIPKSVRGNRFTDEINSIIRSGKRKQKFFFENIQAKGPDGSIRSLNPINLELK